MLIPPLILVQVEDDDGVPDGGSDSGSVIVSRIMLGVTAIGAAILIWAVVEIIRQYRAGARKTPSSRPSESQAPTMMVVPSTPASASDRHQFLAAASAVRPAQGNSTNPSTSLRV